VERGGDALHTQRGERSDAAGAPRAIPTPRSDTESTRVGAALRHEARVERGGDALHTQRGERSDAACAPPGGGVAANSARSAPFRRRVCAPTHSTRAVAELRVRRAGEGCEGGAARVLYEVSPRGGARWARAPQAAGGGRAGRVGRGGIESRRDYSNPCCRGRRRRDGAGGALGGVWRPLRRVHAGPPDGLPWAGTCRVRSRGSAYS